MAEIIGIISGVIAIVGAAKKTISAVSDFRSATKEQNDMLRHLTSVETGLKRLEGALSKVDANDPELDDIRDHLKEFKDAINGIADGLKSSVGSSQLNVRERVNWMRKGKGQAKEDAAKIEEFEQLLAKWLSADMWEKMRKQQENARDEERQKILTWLSPINPFARQDEIFSKRQPDTGTWLLDSSEFKKWKSGEERTLWCFGIPGAGKTILASTVMDYLRKESTKDVGLAIVYCNYKEDEIQTPTNLLSSILRQLYDEISLSDKAKGLHRKHCERKTRPTLVEISELLCVEITRFSNVFIIVDALDECPEENECRVSLLERLYVLQPKVHLMITSRPDVSAPANSLQLDIVAHKEDLERFIDGKLSRTSRLHNLLRGQDDRINIKRTVIEKADGMFLLAQIHMTALATATSRKELSQILENLAKNLDSAYEKTLERIDTQTHRDKLLAWRVLGWVSHALRPMSVRELQEALAMEPEATNIDEDSLQNEEILTSVCAGLVIIDRAGGVFRLVHYTAQQYLEGLRESRFTHTQIEIAQICLTYLSFPGLEGVDLDELFEIPSLLAYAGQYGMVHARGVPEGPLRGVILNLIVPEKKRMVIQKVTSSCGYAYLGPKLLSTLHLAVYFGLSQTVSEILSNGEDINSNEFHGTTITVASWRGFEEIVCLLVESGAEVNAQGGLYGNALQAASSDGHEQIVRLLLEKGADVNAQGGHYGNALQGTSRRGHEQIVRILLEAGANVNAQGGYYGNALQAASSEGHEQIVRILLEAGANVNTQGGGHADALQAASSDGHEQIVRLLLEKGADVNAQGGKYGNTLQAASSDGHEQIVRILLEAGANVNAQGGECGNALQAASRGGHEQIVRILLEKGAEVNAQGGWYGNALQAASSDGHEQIVRILLEAGANVNTQGGGHGNALQAASSEGHEQIVCLLLENGAEVNTQGGHGNALQAASSEGHEQIVRILLEAGANVNAQGGENGNALQAASSDGHEQIARLLLDKDADVNAQGGYYGNALQAASSEGHEQIVRILLEAGANVNAQGGENGNALQAASSEGHEQIVRILLEAGANVNAQGGYYGNALQAASSDGHEQIARLLLDKDADVNAQGGYYGNALQAASRDGHEQIVRLLLEKGADVNAQGGEYGNALQAASRWGHEQIVRILLENDVDVNAQGEYWGNALQVASISGHGQIVHLLLENGADAAALEVLEEAEQTHSSDEGSGEESDDV